VKILDGTSLNDHFWIFYGALSNVEYTLNDHRHPDGRTKTYVNRQGTMASVADTSALRDPEPPRDDRGRGPPIRWPERVSSTSRSRPWPGSQTQPGGGHPRHAMGRMGGFDGRE